jgi:DNA-binding NarL/FixJ family response regulator
MLRTLIVEDNPSFRKLFVEGLQRNFPTILIQEAADGNEALQKVEEFIPELIFMDIRLPRDNGLRLTQEIKRKHPEVTVIILTSFDLPEYRQAAFDSGADCFIGKDSLDYKEIERCGKGKLETTLRGTIGSPSQ